MFQLPGNMKEWEQYKLSEEQLRFYNDQGYLSGIKLLEKDQVDQLNKELEGIMDPEHPNNDLLYHFFSNGSKVADRVLFYAMGQWRSMPGFHDVLWNPAFLMASYQLLGEKAVRFWHDQLFCKPAKHGGVVAWHQDYSYWTRTEPMQHLTMWVGLDDATEENGCLQYIPGSHRWGLLEMPELTGEMEGLKAYLNDEQARMLENPTPIEMERGYATFHHPLLVHGSFENNSERPRRAFVLNVFADGTSSNSDEELLPGIPGIKSGNKMEGQFFPLLY